MSTVFNRVGTDAPEFDDRTLEELCDALLSVRGEVSGNRIAHQLLIRFSRADEEGQLAFFKMLVERFDIDTGDVVNAANELAENNTAQNLNNLFTRVEPRRQELFRRLNRIPGATGLLVDMRTSLLKHMRQHKELARIDIDLQKLFRAWFNRGFLVLREIDWQTPANILEKLIAYEAVHEIRSWQALRRRLAPSDRKCFAFFHPAMLDEPLIFVEVALMHTTPNSIREVLTDKREVLLAENADTAVFYSISNCQEGLAGVSFGNFLIKQVAQELSSQFPGLRYFRTLSPVPGFMRWINRCAKQDITEEQAGKIDVIKRISDTTIADPNDLELKIVQEMAAAYLVNEKRDDKQPLDPVARFHLGNGAQLDIVLGRADVFEKGLKQSAGVMVSYLYDLENVIANHESYATNRKVICSTSVRALLGDKRRFPRLVR